MSVFIWLSRNCLKKQRRRWRSWNRDRIRLTCLLCTVYINKPQLGMWTQVKSIQMVFVGFLGEKKRKLFRLCYCWVIRPWVELRCSKNEDQQVDFNTRTHLKLKIFSFPQKFFKILFSSYCLGSCCELKFVLESRSFLKQFYLNGYVISKIQKSFFSFLQNS